LEVEINQMPTRETAFVLVMGGRLLVKAEDLKRWRIMLPDSPPIPYEGVDYYALDALRGMSYQLDEAAQKISLQATPGTFEATGIRGIATGFVKPDPTPPGGFVNYDLFVSRAAGATHRSGLIELGGFGPWGVLTSNQLVNDSEEDSEIIRLDTTFTRDRPDRLASFRLGDVISNPGAWGGSVRLGGLQYATNFGTQPGFIAFPLPGISGEAILPSTVELYVNDALRLKRDVPMGPFSIQTLPVVTGPGEARLVIRDILGREQVIIQPFFASPRLLQPGLHAYSYELGAIRENFGIESQDYGRLAFVGTHRLGISDRFTGELHGELLEEQQTLGAGGTMLLTPAVFSVALAGSHSDRGTGGLLDVNLEYRARQINFGVSSRMMTNDFVDLGIPDTQQAPRFLNRAFASYSLFGRGSLSVNYTEQDFRDREDLRLLGANYNFPLFNLGYVNFSLLHFLGDDSKTVVGMTFTKALGERTTASITSTSEPGFSENTAQIQRSLPVGSGYGYRALIGDGENSRRQLALSAQNNIGTYLVEASEFRGEEAYRASVAGGIAMVERDVFLSRKITDSFSVVEVPGQADVRVYADNQLIGLTDERGLALIPRVRSYQENRISIEQGDIPLDAIISATSAATVPYFRSATRVKFPVEKTRSAMLQLVQSDGQPVPAGATARLHHNSQEFPVGSDGQLYLSDLQEQNELTVTWQEQQCQLTVELRKESGILPELGVFKCQAAVER
jgi:outer membrane usher protein